MFVVWRLFRVLYIVHVGDLKLHSSVEQVYILMAVNVIDLLPTICCIITVRQEQRVRKVLEEREREKNIFMYHSLNLESVPGTGLTGI